MHVCIRCDGRNLEQQLVLGEALDRFQEVRVQAKLVVQLLLALLEEGRIKNERGSKHQLHVHVSGL